MDEKGTVCDRITLQGMMRTTAINDNAMRTMHVIVSKIDAYGTGLLKSRNLIYTAINRRLTLSLDEDGDEWSDYDKMSRKVTLYLEGGNRTEAARVLFLKKDA